MKKVLLLCIALAFALTLMAQESQSAYTMLRLPASSHVAALGGENISVIDDVPSLGYSNPALYSLAPNRSIGFSFMTYPAGGKLLGFQAARAFGERHTVGLGAQVLTYGSVDETDVQGTAMGSFTPSDVAVSLGYSYLLSDYIAGGANFKLISSKYGQYNSVGIAVDLGLNYYDPDYDISVSAALSNIGTQVKSFHEGQKDNVPLNLQLGITKGLDNLPVRLSFTLTDLTRWKKNYYYTADGNELSFTRKALNHLVVGVDILPIDICYLSLGYNFRRAYELKQAGGSHFAGFSCGAGLNLDRVKIGLSYAQYSLGASSLMANLAFRL